MMLAETFNGFHNEVFPLRRLRRRRLNVMQDPVRSNDRVSDWEL